MPRTPKAAGHAALLLDYLKKNPESTIREIAADTGLSIPQVYAGIHHFRNTYGPMLGENPIINIAWTILRKRDNKWVRSVYKLSDSAKEIKDTVPTGFASTPSRWRPRCVRWSPATR